MAKTVNAAFGEFLSQHVNLDSSETAKARMSRDWLLRQISLFPDKYSDFPKLYTDINIHYGSFARRTKIRELDDLDMVVGISALGIEYIEDGNTVYLSVPDGIALRAFCYEKKPYLNSRRVINKFVRHLSDVPQYNKADIKRDGMAAVLDLTSYAWSFDIVPGFFTTPEVDGRQYYIIPNGKGHWMKTDPRVDQERTRNINQMHDGKVLNVLRTIKYWNRRATMPNMSSYLIECMVLEYYSNKSNMSQYVDVELEPLLLYISNAVLSSIQDPKRIQGDINNISWEERQKISAQAYDDSIKANRARFAEDNGNHQVSINVWRQIFGDNFPKY